MLKTYEMEVLRLQQMPFINYSYLIVDKRTRKAAIIDPAWNLDEIMNIIQKKSAKLSSILLTHSHHDHVQLVEPLVEIFNPKVYMSQLEIYDYGYHCNHLNELYDNDFIMLGDTAISCLLTPGHTAGSMCYMLSHHVFTGDTVFMEGCGYCGGIGGSADQMFDSFQKVIAKVPSHCLVYPGHSYGWPLGKPLAQVRKDNLYFQLDKREYFVKFRMRRQQRGLFDFQ